MAQVDSIQELGQVFLPVSINNGADWHYFILDSGAGMSAIDKGISDRLNFLTIGHTELAGTAGTLDVEIKQLDSITPLRRLKPVQDLIHFGLVATTQDLSQFKTPLPDTPEAGLLGNDYLRHFIVEIDFSPPELHIYRPSGYLPVGVDAASYLPMWLDNNKIMRVHGKLDGWLEVELRLDSGAATLQLPAPEPYLNITTPMWEQLSAKNPEYNFYTSVSAGGMGGKVDLQVGRIKSFDLGPLHWDNISVVVQPKQGIFANPDAVGFISLNLFEPGKWLVFDYPGGKIYLPKS